MAFAFARKDLSLAHLRYVLVLLALMGLDSTFPREASAVTVRTKSDVRLWETVTDRLRPLAWPWEDGADRAELTFSNRIARAVWSVTVVREVGASRGTCDLPAVAATDEALVVATLVQTADGVEVARETAELAYVPQPMTIRTKADRAWRRVRGPRLAGFDASWWNVKGPSGYEVIWAEPAGPHRVVRTFDGAGEVDEAVLQFGMLGLLLLFR